MSTSPLIPGLARFGAANAVHSLLALHPARELATDAPRTLMRLAADHPVVNPGSVAALRRELRDHPSPGRGCLLQVRDVGVHEGRIHALVAPVRSTLAEGRSAGTTGLPRALDHAFRILSALVTLHASGQSHGRISPASVYQGPSGEVLLAPFSWLAAEPATEFRSPEASLGAPAGVASDLYEVGATLYWLLTGASPQGLFQEPAASPRFQQLPRPLAEVIVRATRFEPTQRHRSAVLMAADLQRAAEALGSRVDTSPLGPAFDERPVLPVRRPSRAPAPRPDAVSTPRLPANEQDRLATLVSLAVLDTQTEERFDRHTRLAQRLLGTSMALVSLVDADRQWFKSRVGLDAAQTPREHAFCAHAILSPDKLFEVPDASQDPRFRENPLVTGAPNIRFYAGQPLRAQGRAVGTLCVIDDAPRRLSHSERAILAELAKAVEEELVQQEFEDIDPETGMSNLAGFARHAHLALAWRAAEGRAVRLVHITAPNSVPAPLFAAALARSHTDADALARLDAHSYCALLPAESDAGQRMAQLETALPQLQRSELQWVGVTVDPGDQTVLAALVAHAEALAHADHQRRAVG